MAKDLVVKVGANISDFEKKMAGMSAKMQDIGKKMQQVGKNMTLYVTTPILAMGAAVAKAAMDLEASEAKYNTVFKGMTTQSDAFIKNFKKLTPATTAEARNMASGIQDLLIPMGFMRDEATNITGELMHVAGALTNFNSGTHSAQDVVRAMQSALTGMYRPLKSLGVQLDETTIKEKALEYGLVGVGEEVSNQIKVQVMLKEVYAQSGDALNAYTKENLDAKTSMGLLRADLTDMAVTFGDILLPIIEKIIDKVRGWIEALKNLEPETKKIIMVVAGLAAAVGPLLIALGFLTSTIVPAMIAGGVAIASAWLPLTLLILGVAAAFAVFNHNAKKTKEAVDALVDTKSLDELEQRLAELNKRSQELKDESRNERYTISGGKKRADEQRVIKAEVEQLTKAIEIKNKAEDEAKKIAEQHKNILAELNNEYAISNDEIKENLGLVGELEKKISKLNESMKFASTGEDIRKITDELKDLNKQLDNIYLSARGDSPNLEKIDPIKSKGLFDVEGLRVSGKEMREVIGNINKEITQDFIDFTNEIASLVSSSIATIFEGIGSGMSGAEIGKEFLLNLAKFGQRIGTILISVGFAVEAFKLSLKTLNGVGLIIAGGALLAASSLAVGALQGGMKGGGDGSSYGGGSYGGSGGTIEGLRDWSGLQVSITGELIGRGSDLAAVISEENIRQEL